MKLPVTSLAPRDPYARLARGCRPRGCRAPARRVHGRRVRYVIGDEPGQVNGMRWRTAACAPLVGLRPSNPPASPTHHPTRSAERAPARVSAPVG
ncbi:hypothetical protein [Streptomyces sp. NPDC047028]|uniref:tryptophan biosynthesis modulator TrpM n=1 Tax=Streptomyces sp. NPDC047028 TaxID=3155793 RepID=UPI0033F47397